MQQENESETLSGDTSIHDASCFLLKRAKAGSTRVWSVVQKKYMKRLLLRARSRLSEPLRKSSAAEAEDVVQETLLRFFSKIQRYALPEEGDGTGCVQGRLFLEMDRILAELARKGGEAGKQFNERVVDGLDLGFARTCGEDSAVKHLGFRDAFEKLTAALRHDRLTTMYRRVLIDVYIEGKEPKILAAEEGVSHETYRKRLFRARDLWRELSGIDPDAELL